MAKNEPNGVGTVSDLIDGAIAGRLNRREILRRAAALGVAAPMVAAMLKVSELRRGGAAGAAKRS